MPLKALLIEDEEVTAKLFREILERRGIETRVVAEGAKAIAAADEFNPDLVLLDIGLADEVDGFMVLKSLRNRKSDARIVIITGRGSPVDIVRGFDLKADNYLVKPISEMEFKARIAAELAQIRRLGGAQHSREIEIVYDQVSIRFGGQSGRAYHKNGDTAKLGPMDVSLLTCLLNEPGAIISHKELLRVGWNYEGPVTIIEQNMVSQHIARLRQKIGDDGRLILVSIKNSGVMMRKPNRMS